MSISQLWTNKFRTTKLDLIITFFYMIQTESSPVYKSQKKYISSFHLVIWLFAVSIQLSDDDHQRIKKMYGNTQKMVKVVFRKMETFLETIEQIKKSNKDCLVKILLDQEMYSHLKDLCQQEEKISDIFLWKTTDRFDQDILFRQPELKPIKVMLTLEEAISRAEEQVEKWSKPYKTFKNYNQLTELDIQQKVITINRFRYTLISFINMRTSDFQEAFMGFKHLVESEVNVLEAHLSNMENMDNSGRYLAGMTSRLSHYKSAAQQFHEASQNQNQEAKKQKFYNYVMKFYQEQCFFYHIFNSNLKMIGGEGSKNKNELKYKRKELMLPFNHVYNSIKWLFRKEIQEKNKLYLQPFQTYRVYRSKVSQLNDLKEKLRKMQQTKDSLFIEFYAPISTTKSLKIAIDKFAFFPQEETEKQVIIRINVNSITKYPKFLEQNFNIFLHGFFKMQKQQDKKGLTEQQVLFNALNIFKVTRIHQMTVQDLFSQKERQILKRKQNKSNKELTRQDKYKYDKIFKNLYQSSVTVIDLEFGPFYDVLLEENQFNLGQNEQNARKNYLACINKIGKYKNKFDYTDACVILNDLDECYQILKEKIQQNEFAVSVKDGKNYFQQLAKVCRLLGRVTEALNYTNLAIECHKQLEQVHLNDVYNTHYDKLYDMQLKAIYFYREYSQLGIAQKMLKKMLKQMESHKFENAKPKVRQSQVIMNMGINYYSRGKLDKSVSKFEECRLRLSELIRQCLEQPIPSCYLCSYFINLLCGGTKRQCSYQRYGERLRHELIQQRFRRYGSREEINESRDQANTMLNLTNVALKNQKLFFENQKKYEELIRSNQFDKPQKKERSKRTGQELQKKIRACIAEITKIDDSSSPQYEKHMTQLISLKDELEKNEINFFFEAGVDTNIGEYIKKFLKKEPERRIKQFQKKKDMLKSTQKQKLLQQYTRCAQDIKKNINLLKNEGFVQSTNDMIKERNNLAKVLEKSQQRQEALKEIQKILDSKVAQKDSRFLEYATAYCTRGRIQLQTNKIRQAIESFDNSLEQYQNFWRMTKEKQEVGQEKDQDPNFNQSDHDNEFQMVKIIKIKAILKLAPAEVQIEKKKKILNNVQDKILQIMEIIKNRNPLQDSGELINILNEVHIHYKLNRTPYQNHKEEIFYLLKEMMNLTQEGEYSLKNILVLCQLISSFHTVEDFLLDLRGTDYLQMLKKAKFQCKDADVDIQWRISKAFYFIQLSNKEKQRALWCLRQAINILERLVKDNKNKKHLEDELLYLKKIGAEKLSEVQTTLSTRPLRSHQIIIPINQQVPSSMDQLIPKPK